MCKCIKITHINDLICRNSILFVDNGSTELYHISNIGKLSSIFILGVFTMKRVASFILVLVMLMSALVVGVMPVSAAEKKEITRSIAIVFDNSGSMYSEMEKIEESPKSWCRATYAMEVFATMMNPGDTLKIYPMHNIEVGGKKYNGSNPLKITQDNASDIRKIYTPDPQGTEMQAVTDAYNGLYKEKADEKWLIVLTDEVKDYVADENGDKDLTAKLKKVNEKVNVMVLAIGSQDKPEWKATTFKSDSRKTTSKDILKNLTEMCNTVFGRSSLEVKDNGKIDFDVSMGKLILFVQGNGIKNVSIDGQTPVSTNSLKYSEKKCGGAYKSSAEVDTTLQGMLLTYGAMDAGSFKYSYDGKASSVAVYYEPDVDLRATLVDAAGNPVDPDSGLIAGTYSIEYGMVDRNGNPTNSALLGDTKYEITYYINGEAKTVKQNKAGKIELELAPNDELDAEFQVTYLDGYKIRHTGADFGWPQGGFKILPPEAGFLEVHLSGGAKEYNLTDLSKAPVFDVEFIYDGAALTDTAQLEKIEAKAKLEGGNAVCDIYLDESGYHVKFDYKDGDALKTDIGECELVVSGIYTNDDDKKTNLATAKASLKFTDNSSLLYMDVDAKQSYYLSGELDKGKPFVVNLTLGENKLTDEQLNAVKLTVECEGVKFITEPLEGKSAINVKIDSKNRPENGRYKVKFTAVTKNEIGREVKAEGTAKFEVRNMPLWLRILIPILIILLIIAAIVFFMTRKVLPKNITLVNTDFKVDGEKVAGDAIPQYSGKGSKIRSINIKSPLFSPNPLVKAGITIDVEAVSPRYISSSKREMRVTGINVANKMFVYSYDVGNGHFKRDESTTPPKFVASGAKDAAFKPFNIRTNSPISIASEVADSDGGTSTVTLRTYIRFM